MASAKAGKYNKAFSLNASRAIIDILVAKSEELFGWSYQHRLELAKSERNLKSSAREEQIKEASKLFSKKADDWFRNAKHYRIKMAEFRCRNCGKPSEGDRVLL